MTSFKIGGMGRDNSAARFLAGQDSWSLPPSPFEQIVRQLAEGKKTGDWMWFVFPQIEGLGRSVQAKKYAIRSTEEVVAYLDDSQLGPRYFDCLAIVAGHLLAAANPEDLWKALVGIFGDIDARKFKSSITLFGAVASTLTTNRAVSVALLVDKLHAAGLRPCQATLDWLERQD